MPYKDKEKQKAYARQWCATRRAAFFADKQCCKCGSTDRLELDHIDPKTKVTHRIWSYCEEKRQAEIAKCQVLCYECHTEKTWTKDQRGERHHSAKLSDQDVLDIRRLKEEGVSTNELALRYLVSARYITGICSFEYRAI